MTLNGRHDCIWCPTRYNIKTRAMNFYRFASQLKMLLLPSYTRSLDKLRLSLSLYLTHKHTHTHARSTHEHIDKHSNTLRHSQALFHTHTHIVTNKNNLIHSFLSLSSNSYFTRSLSFTLKHSHTLSLSLTHARIQPLTVK